MHPRATLAAYLVLRDHLNGLGTTAEMSGRVAALLRPLRGADGLLTEALGLDRMIAELAASFPEEARAAHLTRVSVPVPC